MLKMMELKKNSERLTTLNHLLDLDADNQLIVKWDKKMLNIHSKKELKLFKALNKAGLIENKINDNLLNDYYSFYCSLVHGYDNALKTAKNEKISVYQAYNRGLFKTYSPKIFVKIIHDHEYIDEPIKIFRTMEEMQAYKTKIKKIKKMIPMIQQQAFELAKENMELLGISNIKKKEYYDELFIEIFCKKSKKYVKKSA